MKHTLYIQYIPPDKAKYAIDAPEYNAWQEACEEYGVGFVKEEFESIVLKLHELDSQYTWFSGSIGLHKVAPFPNTLINYSLYSEIFIRKYIDRSLFLNDLQHFYVDKCKLSEVAKALKHYSDKLFARSTTADKRIFGAVYTQDELMATLEQRLTHGSDLWLSVAAPKDIGRECRFILQMDAGLKVPFHRIVSGAEYITEEGKVVSSGEYCQHRLTSDDDAWYAANCMLSPGEPGVQQYLLHCKGKAGSPVVMDLVWDRSDKRYKILEFNPFWSSGIYGNSVHEIIKTIANEQ